jgi:hypothetical protein
VAALASIANPGIPSMPEKECTSNAGVKELGYEAETSCETTLAIDEHQQMEIFS